MFAALLLVGCCQASTPEPADAVLVEAEAFADPGGWTLDTQFTFEMGSPYLLAHGLGRPVAAAHTEIELPRSGDWRVWVRTKDWVARWNAPGTPGRFALEIDGVRLQQEFGTHGRDWGWQDGGVIHLSNSKVGLALIDLTGFEGRCDAILFTAVGAPPPADQARAAWRDGILGNRPLIEHSAYDLVVVGGGYAGMGASISAARMGARVALIQDRPVLGGNGSSEVRVWSKGEIRRGRFPRIGEIVEEFADSASKSPGAAEEFGDAHKEAVVSAEPNVDLFLLHRMDGVEMAQGRIAGVRVLDIRSGQRRVFRGRNYCDATGHGWLGALAGADGEVTADGRMGMSNMWTWENTAQPQEFPRVPWALDLEMEDFPYPHRFHGEWFWESGFDQDPLADAEGIRDWNLRAVYGAFRAMKQRGGADQHRNARLTWIAPIGGPRESRRLFGDVILTQEDVVSKRAFVDGCVPSTWTIDLHYPKKQYARKFPDNPFISIAVHDDRVDRDYGYPVPYRAFYSRNVPNLFMAGRCISVTHQALGTVRVMRTCGMMGEVVGKAAALCAQLEIQPAAVFPEHWPRMEEMLELPGSARRKGLHGDWLIPTNATAAAGAYGPLTGVDPTGLPGVVVDDRQAECIGQWTQGSGLPGYIGWGYRYANPDSGACARFLLTSPQGGSYQLELAYRAHANRGSDVPVRWLHRKIWRDASVDMRTEPRADGFVVIGKLELKPGEQVECVVASAGAGGYVCIDACRLVAVQ